MWLAFVIISNDRSHFRHSTPTSFECAVYSNGCNCNPNDRITSVNTMANYSFWFGKTKSLSLFFPKKNRFNYLTDRLSPCQHLFHWLWVHCRSHSSDQVFQQRLLNSAITHSHLSDWKLSRQPSSAFKQLDQIRWFAFAFKRLIFVKSILVCI